MELIDAHDHVHAEAIAEIKGLPLSDVAQITTGNARRLFPRAFVRLSYSPPQLSPPFVPQERTT